MDIDPRRLADAIDHSEIRRLYEDYADVVTRRQWTALADLFLPDLTLRLDLRESTLEVNTPQAVGDFIDRSVSQFAYFQFLVLGVKVQLRLDGDDDTAAGRLYMSELRQTHSGHWSQIYGVYHDRFRRVSDRWWFAERAYHSLARNNMPAAIYDFPHHLRMAGE